MNSSNPFRALIFMVGVAAVLGLTALLLPKKGVQVGAVKLKFIAPEEIVQAKTTRKKDISDIVAKVNTKEQKIQDGTHSPKSKKGKKPSSRVVNYEINNATVVHFDAKGKSALHQFFKKAKSVFKQKKKLHVLHFGDSQIEGDRMTGFIRQRLQEKFGGFGPGLIPARNVYNTYSFVQKCSQNFKRHTCFGGPRLPNRKYGVNNSAARFTGTKTDSNSIEQEAWIEVGPNYRAHGRAQYYNNVKMLYNSCTLPCSLTVYQGETIVHTEELNTDGGEHTTRISFNGNAGKLKFVFNSKRSPNIVGFSLEGDYGIQVDNIAMRGSSGTFFGSINKNSFANRLAELNVDLVIMQFGGNTLPSLSSKKAAVRHAKYFKSQLQALQRMRPGMAIIMIGPSDMAKRRNGEYSTYPLLPFWVEQLKKSALETGVGYWDLYEAMGGKNSMPAWVEQDLGRPDHVHFSVKGARIAAQLFYDAFMSEYTNFQGGE